MAFIGGGDDGMVHMERIALGPGRPHIVRDVDPKGPDFERAVEEILDFSTPPPARTSLSLNCDQVRRRINNLIDNQEMTVKQLCEQLDVTSPAYYRFMHQHGPDKGMQSSVYANALDFFERRQEQGIKEPRAKRARKSYEGTGTEGGKKSEKPALQASDLADIKLDGEDEDKVPVYDTCDEIRRKIAIHLKKPNVTQASFLRDLMAQFHTQEKRLQSSQLQRFRNNKGADAGNTNPVFYAAYCFFEKLRIKEGKPKSKDRLRMEELYPNGMNVTDRNYGYFTCLEGESIEFDKYGGVSFGGRPPVYR